MSFSVLQTQAAGRVDLDKPDSVPKRHFALVAKHQKYRPGWHGYETARSSQISRILKIAD